MKAKGMALGGQTTTSSVPVRHSEFKSLRKVRKLMNSFHIERKTGLGNMYFLKHIKCFPCDTFHTPYIHEFVHGIVSSLLPIYQLYTPIFSMKRPLIIVISSTFDSQKAECHSFNSSLLCRHQLSLLLLDCKLNENRNYDLYFFSIQHTS